MLTESITESPGHLITIGVLLTCFSTLLWFMTRKRIFAFLALLLAIGTISIIFIERAIITDREQLTIDIFDLAEYVANGDADGVASHVAPEKTNFVKRIRDEMSRINLSECRLTGFNEKTINGHPPDNAFFDFVVWASGSGHGQSGTGAVRVALEFEKRGDKWLIVAYDYVPANVNSNRDWSMKR